MKNLNFILVLVLLILVSGIGIVSAETITGTLGATGLNTTSYTQIYQATGGAQPASITNLYIKDIQYTAGIAYLIRYDITAVPTFTGGSPVGNTTPVIFKIGTTQIGTGTFGYQRLYTSGGTETFGYQFLVFNGDWIGSSSYMGDQQVTVTGIPIDGITYAISAYNNQVLPYSGAMKFGTSGNGWFGNYTIQKSLTFNNDYSTTKPSGIGITGYINKTSGGSTYPSRAWIFDGTTDSALTSESTLTSTQFNFTTSVSTIKIGVQDSTGAWYNSSVLFSPAATPTPTPTPTPTVTLNPGEFWVTFAAEDATTGGLISGAEVDIYSQFTGTWDNATTSTGERKIVSSPDNYYNVNGNASGYTNGTLSNAMAYANAYYLVHLFPTSGLPSVPGQVNLFVSVTERETGSPIAGAAVSVATPGSWTVQGETDNTGVELFSTSNSSVKYITVSKNGYKSETRTITTPSSGNYNAALQMSRLTVTTAPTSTVPPGGVTPAVTVDSRSTGQKDTDMMNMIRDNGPSLIQLAIAVTMISLLGLMTKGFK